MRRICTRPDHCCAVPALNRSHHFVHASAFFSGWPCVASLLCVFAGFPAVWARAFFTDFPCVASAFSLFGIAAGSPPSLRDGYLLRPHRSPYCLRALSLCNLTEKCSSPVEIGRCPASDCGTHISNCECRRIHQHIDAARLLEQT